MSDLAQAIEKYVKQYDYVTFPELQKRLGDRFEMKGNVEVYLQDNLVLWAGMSEEFAAAIIELQETKRIYPEPTVYLTYLIDGGALSLPIPKRFPKGGFKKLYWIPVCFRHIDTDKDRAGKQVHS